MYIYPIHKFCLYAGKNVCRDVCFSSHPSKARSRQKRDNFYLVYSVPLCRNDIMLTLERFFGPLSCHVMSCDAITNIASKCVILKTNFKHHEEKTADCRQ